MPTLKRVSEGFKSNADSVYELLEFDTLVLDHVVGGLNQLAHDLEAQGRNVAARTVTNRVAALQNVRNSESLRPRYATIFNQCVVLLVSYFGSAVHSLFIEAVSTGLREGCGLPAGIQEVKFVWRDLSARESPTENVFADLLVAQRDISFQDMQSISKAFSQHIGLELQQDETTNDIILGQACRHVIVHAGGIVDAKMVRQVNKALPRTLKPSVRAGDDVRFDPHEVRHLGGKMSEYLDRLVDLTRNRLGASKPAG